MDEAIRKRVLAILFVGVLMGALDIAIVGPALPAIQRSYGVDNRALAWVFNIFVLFALAGAPLMAKLSDRLGRRLVYALDLALFGIGSLVIVAAPSFGVLLAGRAIQAVGASGIFPIASAVIGDSFPEEKRGQALGLIGAVFGVAFLIGPLLGGLLLQLSWHWLFLINPPIAAVLIWLSLRTLPSTKPDRSLPFDFAGVATLSLLLLSLTFGITQIDAGHFVEDILSGNVIVFLAIAVFLVPVFIAVERRAVDPMVRPSLFASRQVSLASALAMGAGLTEAAMIFLPALAVAAFAFSESKASFMLTPLVLALMVGSPGGGWLVDRVGAKFVVQLGLALISIGLLIFSVFTLTVNVFIAAEVLVGLGLSVLLGAPIRYIYLSEATADERGATQGLLTVFISIGQLCGAAVVGGVAASFNSGAAGYQAGFLSLFSVTTALFLLSFALKRKPSRAVS